MKINHHLDDATLLSYSSGSLSQAMALVVACHLSMCQQCKQRLMEHQAVGGVLLENLPETQISDSALGDVLARLDSDEPVISVFSSQAKVAAPQNTPQPLADFLGYELDDVQWKRMAPGVSYHDIDCNSSRGVSRLLKIGPGRAMLPHSHDGNELTLILEGSFSDEIGRFRQGDIADLDETIDHQPLVDSEIDCICLVATDSPLKFSSLLGKLVQPLTGF